MNKNYTAWDIKIEDFSSLSTDVERLRFLVGFAVLAPSSHNSQPWKFSVKNNSIFVSADMGRSLPESDTNHRQLVISLGCAIENILIAADYFGCKCDVDLSPATAGKDLLAVLRCTFTGERTNKDQHLIHAIQRRCSNRSRYESKNIDELFLNWLTGLSDEELQVYVISDQDTKNKIADVVLDAGVAAMEMSGFRKELSKYVKNNYTRSCTGMPLFGFGVPGPVSLIAPTMMKFINMNKVNRKADEKILKENTPYMLVISSKLDDRKTWLKVGMLYEKITLEATKRKIATAVYAAPIQIGEFYKDLKKILNIQLRPQFFARIGYSKDDVYHSPRLHSVQVMMQ